MKKFLIILAFIFAFLQPLAAQNQTSPETAPTPEKPAAQNAQPMGEDERINFMVERESGQNASAPSSGGLIVRTLGAMCLIVGLIFAVAWGLKKFGLVQFGKQNEESQDLAVLSTVSLGANRTLSIVKFGRRTLLVGATPQSIALLATENGGQQIAPRSVADLLADNEEVVFENELANVEFRLANFGAQRSEV